MKTTGTINRAGRVRVEQARKRVRAYLAGEVVADTTQPSLVWEVPYYPTYYFPVADVRTDLLVPTATTTHCPYKGQAQYWSVRVGDRLVEDLAWSYRTTLPESQKIAGLVAFYNEHVDLFIDGQLQQRPVTKFSK